MDHELSIDLVLQSLSSSFSQFVMNCDMNQKDMILPKLLNMLKTAEGCLKKEPSSVLVVSSSKSKKKGFKKNKNKKQKASTNIVNFKGGVKKKSNDKGTCFNCGVEGHWKRNCPSYLASLKDKKSKEASSSGGYTYFITFTNDHSRYG
ncbi:hypothetical protein K2173_002402 [Erythroxylum novogranatense]|uniref:CCHC-type domain-containing protein n=1 Tax=Erythroxylum novogranatense TaxID=1862640 RepID=A0AAV8TB04_9ROSI|nr:hypothetical protein K2173_002402 [Erythroxylum novogranatense]